MFLLNWYREYLDIKCEKLAKSKELEYCESCETLKLQLSIVNDERKRLIDKLVKDDTEVEESEVENLIPLQPNKIAWNTRRQMMEAEDRERAKILKKNIDNQPQSSKTLTISEIEKELGVTGN